MSDADSPLQFPCEFPIKAMGPAGATFERTVQAIITRHAPDAGPPSVTESRQGTYVSVTLTITATSREQLDAIYADLRAESSVLAAL